MLFLNVHQARERASLFGSTLLQLLFRWIILLWRNRKIFPHALPFRKEPTIHVTLIIQPQWEVGVPPFRRIQNHNLASTAPMSCVKGQFLDQDMLLYTDAHATPYQGRTEQFA